VAIVEDRILRDAVTRDSLPSGKRGARVGIDEITGDVLLLLAPLVSVIAGVAEAGCR